MHDGTDAITIDAMSHQVAPDGSPVDIYLALPPGDAPDIIDSALRPQSAILELGSGPGRVTHPLVDRGHRVMAVDDSTEMLRHVRGAETVQADVFTLDLGRTFDAVIAGSHFINVPEESRRLELLAVCHRHVKPDGVVLVERYRPGWALAPEPNSGSIGEVGVDFEPVAIGSERFRGRMTYRLGSRSWIQEFEAAEITDEMLAAEAAAVGLTLTDWLDDDRTWGRLEPATP